MANLTGPVRLLEGFCLALPSKAGITPQCRAFVWVLEIQTLVSLDSVTSVSSQILDIHFLFTASNMHLNIDINPTLSHFSPNRFIVVLKFGRQAISNTSRTLAFEKKIPTSLTTLCTKTLV